MSDQREGGSIGGQYHSAADRSAAGVNSFDTAGTAQAKLIGNSVGSGSSGSDLPYTPGPKIFTDPDVARALIKGACWLAFFVAVFYMVVFKVPDYFGGAVSKIMPHNSDNWQYRVAGEGAGGNKGFGIAQVVSGKDPKIGKLKPEVLKETYQAIYGSTLNSEQYHSIVNSACNQGICNDVNIAKVRDMAIQNNTVKAFDKQTANALTTYWSKADPKTKYDYQPYYSGCKDKGQECVNSVIDENYRVSYRNILEKEVE